MDRAASFAGVCSLFLEEKKGTQMLMPRFAQLGALISKNASQVQSTLFRQICFRAVFLVDFERDGPGQNGTVGRKDVFCRRLKLILDIIQGRNRDVFQPPSKNDLLACPRASCLDLFI